MYFHGSLKNTKNTVFKEFAIKKIYLNKYNLEYGWVILCVLFKTGSQKFSYLYFYFFYSNLNWYVMYVKYAKILQIHEKQSKHVLKILNSCFLKFTCVGKWSWITVCKWCFRDHNVLTLVTLQTFQIIVWSVIEFAHV